MQRKNRVSECSILTCAAAVLLISLAAMPALATEAELKAEAKQPEPAPRTTATSPAESPSEDTPDMGFCLETPYGGVVDVKTLEDVFAPSSGNAADLVRQAPDKVTAAETPAEEVRWQKVETAGKKAEPARDSEGD